MQALLSRGLWEFWGRIFKLIRQVKYMRGRPEHRLAHGVIILLSEASISEDQCACGRLFVQVQIYQTFFVCLIAVFNKYLHALSKSRTFDQRKCHYSY